MARTLKKTTPVAELMSLEDEMVRSAATRLRSNPKDWDALTAVGTYFLAHGHADKALDCFHKITRSNPKYPGIWRLKAEAFEALGDTRNADRCRQRGADPRS